jgi:hypothetical protein
MAENENIGTPNGIKVGSAVKSWEQAQPSYESSEFNVDARNPGGASAQGKVSTSSQNEAQNTSENDGPSAARE